MTATEQAATLFVLLFEHPFMTLVLITGITFFVIGIKKFLDDIETDRRAQNDAEAERQAILAEVEDLNAEVTGELEKLTALARRQLAGERVDREAEQVLDHFEVIQEVVEVYSDDDLRSWVKAVTDLYRLRMRSLVASIDRKEFDVSLGPEILEDIHRQAVVDLRVKVRADGAIMYKAPRDREGNLFDLQRAEALVAQGAAAGAPEEIPTSG